MDTETTPAPRYRAVSGSVLGHGCCFRASVVYGSADNPDVMCECFGMEDAERIAAALNAAMPPAQERDA
jgi:hypothetical protein